MEQKKRYTLRLVKELADLVEAEAKKKGVSVNAVIVDVLWKWKQKN
jgi:predicted HicB family RNase H-like nuclease